MDNSSSSTFNLQHSRHQRTQDEANAATSHPKCRIPREPSIEPNAAKLERFELFSTNQCYYLVGCNEMNTAYRVLKMDRTRIERPLESQSTSSNNHTNHPVSNKMSPSNASSSYAAATAASHGMVSKEINQATTALADNSHMPKPTLRPLAEFLTEDPNVYSQDEIRDMLDMIHDGNRMTRADDGTPGVVSSGVGGGSGGLKPIVKAYGVVGFIRFLDCYYLTLVTRRAKVGVIGGNGVYTIKNTETIPLKPAEKSPIPGPEDLADPSSVLLSMWNRGKRSVGLGLSNREIAELRYQGLYQVVDLTKNFYFSYTYDITRSLQENFLAGLSQPFPPPPFKDMYAWNYALTREFETCLNSMTSYHWILPIIHGAFIQRKVNDYGRSLNLILIARRSRHFAGTRYLKRGVSEQGKVANDVEHEQILHDESKSPTSGAFSSYLQVRGSIPTYWTQEGSVTMPKPPIEISRVDLSYNATQLHFEDLLRRYSSPILVLDLVKQSEKREREVRVGNAYRHAIEYINDTISEQHKIRYCSLDYSHISKHRNLDVSASLNEVSVWAVNQTGFFCSSPKWKIRDNGNIVPFSEEDAKHADGLAEQLGVPVFPMEQNGVLRTNCIDCLDRTNVAQFSAGVEAIAQQLVVMGIRSRSKLDPSSTIVRVLIDMYVDIGDCVALQYGGSEAHKKVTAEKESSISGPIGKHKELLTSIRRYYSNAFTDRMKQDAMNLFLGYFQPYRHSFPLWELENDYYLHNFRGRTLNGRVNSLRSYEKALSVQWTDEADSTVHNDLESTVSSSIFSRPRSKVGVGTSHKSESKKVAKVRERCKAQENALSNWWKVALQANLQQRMWMTVGHHNSESILPPRFDRVYEPEKLSQFDRFFSRPWASPLRRSHAAQHSDELTDNGEIGDRVRVVSTAIRAATDRSEREDVEAQEQSRLVDYITVHGHTPVLPPSLKHLKQHYANFKQDVDAVFIGSLGSIRQTPKAEYVRYVSPSSEVFPSPHSHRTESVKEFTAALHDYTLKADDVEGIRKLSESAHLDSVIRIGSYRGLAGDTSAVEVATTLYEQLNTLETRHNNVLVEDELSRRGLNMEGVKECLDSRWDAMKRAEQQYREIVESNTSDCIRSDLTTTYSFQLYASMFDGNTELSTTDLIFLKAEPLNTSKQRRKENKASSTTSSFVKKAMRLGIQVSPNPTSEAEASKRSTVLNSDEKHSALPGFEQINDDLYALRDNKFVVFNHAGSQTWSGTKAATRISNAAEILLSTLPSTHDLS